jgi:2-succinyl-6-hydroxy-2,4-cyclohexadiene-1-carboxylate synthase
MSERRLVFLHGFTQTHHHWHACAQLIARWVETSLGDQPTLRFVDLPGHGLSEAERLTIEQAAPQLVTLAGRGTYIGYSMGARHALTAACAGAPEIERLVLVGGTAGLADPSERDARIAHDEAKARHLEQIGVEAFVDEWLSQPMFTGLAVADADRRHRLRNTIDGLAASLRLAGTGAQEPLWDALADVQMPVLVLAGERDGKFTEVGWRMASAMPNARFAAIPNAGHAAHAEQPEATAALVAGWLSA